MPPSPPYTFFVRFWFWVTLSTPSTVFFFCFLNFGVLSTTYISLYTVFAFIILYFSSNDRLDDDDEQSRSVAVALVVVVVVVVVEVEVVVVVTSSGSSRG